MELTGKHKGGERSFTQLSKAWYGEACLNDRKDRVLDEIMIGIYRPEGGTTGEFAVRWLMVGGEPTPRLEVFEDSWGVLPLFSDFMELLVKLDGMNPSADSLAIRLRELGIKDKTETKEGEPR